MNKPGAGVPWDPGAGGTPRAGVISAGLRVTVGRREAVPRSLRPVEARVGVPAGWKGTEAGSGVSRGAVPDLKCANRGWHPRGETGPIGGSIGRARARGRGVASSRGGWSRDARTSERIGRALGPRGLALGRGEEIEGRAERLGDVALRPALRGLCLRRRPARDAGASARGLPGHGRGRAHGRRAHVRAVVGVSCDDDGRRGGSERQARASGREQRRGDGHRQII